MSMESKEGVDLWVARDKNGSLGLYVGQKPFK